MEVALYASNEPALQLRLVLQSLTPDQRLTRGTALPPILRYLVAADVDVPGWKERHDLIEHVLQKGERTLIAYAIDLLHYTPSDGDGNWFTGAA